MDWSKLTGYLSLSGDTNKIGQGDNIEQQEGVISELSDELKLSTPDEELIKISKNWIKEWQPYEVEMRKKQEKNEKYWLGQHSEHIFDDDDKSSDNIIFEALETFLPEVSKQNPEPLVMADNTEEGLKQSKDVRNTLVYLSDTNSVKLKTKKVVRYWSLYYLGVGKVGWSLRKNDITYEAVRPQKLILDPNATVNEQGIYEGEYLGEYKKDTAYNLVKRFPEKAEYIRYQAKDKMGTKIQYIEWWGNFGESLFWTLKDVVLKKTKNPHWNYDGKETRINDYGTEIEVEVKGSNHFALPQIPYVFLSVFNLGKQPHDETSLIEQNIPLQNIINKRQKQIDKNADSQNNGLVLSGDYFTQEQAKTANDSLRRGDALFVPQGDVRGAYARDASPALARDIYQQLIDSRNELRNIFGTSGLTPEGIKSEQTVRGKILISGRDQSRNSIISEHLEQFYDRLFNWFVQMIYVYYDEDHLATIVGTDKAQELTTLRNSDLTKQLVVSIKEGSLIPKDPLTQRNEAVDMFAEGAISLIELHKKLDMPDPKESAKEALIWQTDPVSLFQEEGSTQGSPTQTPPSTTGPATAPPQGPPTTPPTGQPEIGGLPVT